MRRGSSVTWVVGWKWSICNSLKFYFLELSSSYCPFLRHQQMYLSPSKCKSHLSHVRINEAAAAYSVPSCEWEKNKLRPLQRSSPVRPKNQNRFSLFHVLFLFFRHHRCSHHPFLPPPLDGQWIYDFANPDIRNKYAETGYRWQIFSLGLRYEESANHLMGKSAVFRLGWWWCCSRSQRRQRLLENCALQGLVTVVDISRLSISWHSWPDSSSLRSDPHPKNRMAVINVNDFGNCDELNVIDRWGRFYIYYVVARLVFNGYLNVVATQLRRLFEAHMKSHLFFW